MSPHAVADLKLFAAYAVFRGSYLVFALGKFPGMKIDRPGAGVIGAVLMVAFRIVQPGDALRHIDFSTIVLLFSMMLIVAYLHLAGLFDWITHLVVTRLKPHHLLPTVIFTSMERGRGFDSPRLHFHATGTPIARSTAFSISTIRPGARVSPNGRGMRRSRRSVVICSHFAMEGRRNPPSRARNLTWVGASRSTLDSGTTITSLASRLRTSGETTSAGRRLAPGSSGI